MSIKFNKLYDYPRSMRTLVGGKRHYDIREEKLPSVTTILSACQSDEKRASLEAWRQRLGPKTADIARDLAAERGTAMHRFLEAHIDGSGEAQPPHNTHIINQCAHTCTHAHRHTCLLYTSPSPRDRG